MKTEFYLERLRAFDGLRYVKLKKISIMQFMNVITFYLVTDRAFTAEEKKRAEAISQDAVPNGYHAAVEIEKLVAEESIVRGRVREILSRQFPAANAVLQDDAVSSVRAEGEVTVKLGVSDSERALVGEHVLKGLKTELEKIFCGTFTVLIEEQEKESISFDEEVEEEDFVVGCRFFPIQDFSNLDGAQEKPKYATYIADGMNKAGNMNLCGAITFIREKETQKGKPFYTFTIDDGTSSTRVTYFTRQRTLEKIKALKEGDWIVCSGTNEDFKGSLSFNVKAINYGRAPERFVPEKRACRPVPQKYRLVFPEPFVDFQQDDLFGREPLPQEFLTQEFVVFDLETTGISNNPSSGMMDAITEIGAVRIRNGVPCEKFSSFVACHRQIPPAIVDLTGITDEMLVGAPEVGDVLIDFFKFCNGAPMVGHNVMFDYKFISHYGEAQDVRFDVKLYDTLTIAQQELRLANYKLNTIADYFGVIFQHHRAFDDALATAKIFIELIRGKKCLPK